MVFILVFRPLRLYTDDLFIFVNPTLLYWCYGGITKLEACSNSYNWGVAALKWSKLF